MLQTLLEKWATSFSLCSSATLVHPHLFEVQALRTITTEEAMKFLIDEYSGRNGLNGWDEIVISQDTSGLSNCIGLSSTFQRVMNRSGDSRRLIVPLCAVFKNLFSTTPGDEENGLGNFFIQAGTRFIGAYAKNSEKLGHFEEVAEIFRLLNEQLSRHNPSPEHTYSVKDLTEFVVSNLERLDARDLQSFLAYGSMLTHLHQEDHHQILLKKIVVYNHDEDGEFPSLPMNQALTSVFIGAMGRAAHRIDDMVLEPEQPFAEALLRLSDQLFKLDSGGCHIPGCQLMDLQVVSQTVTALSKAYVLTEDPALRKRYEQGLGALVNLTIKAPGSKLTVVGSVYAQSAHTKKELVSRYTHGIIDRLIKEAQERPPTGSLIIEAAALRFNRQIYLELAFRAPQVLKFDLAASERKLQLLALADVARDGLKTKEDFSSLGKTQKLWLTRESGDELTKMALLKTHPELLKDTFTHDLGL
ncbi:hypothetical protein [Pseudomonas serbica]|uniref:hypothetical protein n=1 Tax=Pseudomonas serbica TaxID=2965074 RepID=UPI00237BFB61|nr:hypothetical protein [Pseudomonas serbica]